MMSIGRKMHWPSACTDGTSWPSSQSRGRDRETRRHERERDREFERVPRPWHAHGHRQSKLQETRGDEDDEARHDGAGDEHGVGTA